MTVCLHYITKKARQKSYRLYVKVTVILIETYRQKMSNTRSFLNFKKKMIEIYQQKELHLLDP